jgi:hypothetical protein
VLAAAAGCEATKILESRVCIQFGTGRFLFVCLFVCFLFVGYILYGRDDIELTLNLQLID